MRLDRLNDMEQFILAKGTVSLEDLVDTFKMSANTIRRDLSELIERGNVSKVYGGVSAAVNTNYTPLSATMRQQRNPDAKKVIGQLAAQFVQPNASILLDTGTTTPHLVPHLAGRENVTILTSSLPVINEAAANPNLNLIALGGVYDSHLAAFNGIDMKNLISSIHLDVLFLATIGLSLSSGVTDKAYPTSEYKRNLIRYAKAPQIVLLADHTKFNNPGIFLVCRLNELQAVVTDQKPPEEYLEFFQRENIQCVYPNAPASKPPAENE